MEKWKNKKTIRGMIIGLVVVVTLVVAVVNTKITPAKSVGDTAEISREAGEKLGGKKSSTKDEAGDDKNHISTKEGAKPADSKNQEADVSDTDLPDKKGTANEVDTSNGKTPEKESGSSTNKNPEEKPESGTENKPTPQPEKSITCSVSITCDAISGNGKLTSAGHPELEPYAANATILGTTSYTLKEGATAFDILKQACRGQQVEFDAEYTEAYDSYYVKSINHLPEIVSAGTNGGWMYLVNGVSPNVGASSYELSEGDAVTWYYVIW